MGVAWDMWEHRNGILHLQENHMSAAEDRRSKREAGQLFNELRMSSVLTRDNHLLQLPFQSLVKKPLAYRKAWTLNAISGLQAINKKLWLRRMREQHLLHNMRGVMGRWLGRRDSE
jgi:hypothetical protein